MVKIYDDLNNIENKSFNNNLNLNIKARSTVALVGESGSGKSSIASLIGHLYYKNSGSIKLGGIDINSLNKKFIREDLDKEVPTMLRYDTHAKNGSMYNTPPTFAISPLF